MSTVTIVLVCIALILGLLITLVLGVPIYVFRKRIIAKLKRRLNMGQPGQPSRSQSTTTPQPSVATEKKRWPTWAVFLIAFFVLSTVSPLMIVIHNTTGGGSFAGNAAVHVPPPPESRTCPDMLQAETWGKNNHSASAAKAVVFDPCSKTEILWDAYATLPSFWATGSWYAEFTDADPKKDGCVAWLRYEGKDRAYGPFTGDQDMALSNMPARFRIASNCQIMYYKG